MSPAETLDRAREACRAGLQAEGYGAALSLLNRLGLDRRARLECVSSIWHRRTYPAEHQNVLAQARNEIGHPELHLVDRAMVLETCAETVNRIADLPLDPAVKRLICQEFTFYSSTKPDWSAHFDPEGLSFRAYCGHALLLRLPAGQFSWNQAGLQRSALFEMPIALKPALLRRLMRMGGLAPCFEPHMAVLRKPFAALIERECLRSYHRMARTMELQPQIKGLMAASWLFDEHTVRLTPHIAFLRKLFEENGGFVGPLRYCDQNAGFLQGSETRRKAYEDGSYRPKETLVLWPRAAMIDWAKAHPELADPA